MGLYGKKFIREIETRGLSPSTKKLYLRSIIRLFEFYNKCPSQINLEEIKDYLHHLSTREVKPLAPISVNRECTSIKFFYTNVLGRDYENCLPRMKIKKTQPTILSIEEVRRLIESIHKVQYKAILLTFYATGIRNSELRHLTIDDIDRKNMVIKIRNGKGGKDRLVRLPLKLLKVLETYWRLKRCKKTKWLFTPSKVSGRDQEGSLDKPLSATAIAYIFKVACKAAGIKKRVTPHCLRHSFAVHLMQKNVHIRHIQHLLGHSDIRTTMHYTTIVDIQDIDPPKILDGLVFGDKK